MQRDPLLELLESALNRGISRSSSARGLCRELNARTLSVNVSGGPEFKLSVDQDRVKAERVEADSPSPDVQLSASPMALLRMLVRDPEGPFRDGSAKLSGDAETAEGFRALLTFASPDAEEELSRIIGDVPARQVSQALSAVASWGEKSALSLGRSLAEYLTEETRTVVSPYELDWFNQEVNQLVNDVDRTSQRIERMAARIAGESR